MFLHDVIFDKLFLLVDVGHRELAAAVVLLQAELDQLLVGEHCVGLNIRNQDHPVLGETRSDTPVNEPGYSHLQSHGGFSVRLAIYRQFVSPDNFR